MNASSKCASWASSPRVRPRLRWTSPRSGSSRPAARRSSVVLPAPFGPTRPIRSPRAIAASIASRMTNVPTSRVTPVSRRMLIDGSGRRVATPTRARARRPARRGGPLRSLGPACAAARPPRRASARASPPRPARSSAAGPTRPAGHRPQDRRGTLRSAAGSRWHHEQKWVERAPMTIRLIGRPQRGHGSPVRW